MKLPELSKPFEQLKPTMASTTRGLIKPLCSYIDVQDYNPRSLDAYGRASLSVNTKSDEELINKFSSDIQLTVQNLPQIGKYILENCEKPVDIVRNLCKKQFIIFVEQHDHDEAKKFGTSMLKVLKEENINHVGIEINHHEQKFIDAFLDGLITEDGLKESVPYINNACSVDFLKECKRLKMKVVCLDLDASGRMSGRDEFMIDRIKSEVLSKNPSEKMFIYIGKMHSSKGSYGSRCKQFLGGLLDNLAKDNVASINIAKANSYRNIPKNLSSNTGFYTNNDFLGKFILEKDSVQANSEYFNYYDAVIQLN